MIDYTLTRCSKRKSIALQIVDGKVFVKAPTQVSVNYINKLLLTKENWIEQKIRQHLVDSRFANKLCHEGNVWINGVARKVVVTFGNVAGIEIRADVAYCAIKRSANLADSLLVKKTFENWFKQHATAILTSRTIQLSEITELKPKDIVIKKYTARWGSCDNFGRISLNYFLLMLPDWVIDYVIIHELCHLKHLNHSPSFWSLVESHCHNFQQAKSWIKAHQGYLVWPKN